MSERFVNAAKASRRNLSFQCTGCLKEDLARIEQAHQAGRRSPQGSNSTSGVPTCSQPRDVHSTWDWRDFAEWWIALIVVSR